MMDTKGLEKHIEQLEKRIDSLDTKIEGLEDEKYSLQDELRELNKQLLDAQRNTIEYHKGDLLLTYKKNFYYHDTICQVYEILEEVKPFGVDTSVEALDISLDSCDNDICTRIQFTKRIDLVDYEQREDVYYLKSSALPDLLMVFHELAIERVPDGSSEKIDAHIFGKIKEVIDRYNGKKLVDVIAETNNYRNKSEGND